MTPTRIRLLHKARSYASTIKPTDEQAHALCGALVEMLWTDRNQRVAVIVGDFVIAQRGGNPVSQALR